MSDVSNVGDEEPPKTFTVTDRVPNVPMNANIFVNFSDPPAFFPFTEIMKFVKNFGARVPPSYITYDDD